MPVARHTSGALVAGGALTATLAALVHPGMLGVRTTSSDPSRIIANTQWGPLTEGDRDFRQGPVGRTVGVPVGRARAGEGLDAGDEGGGQASGRGACRAGRPVPQDRAHAEHHAAQPGDPATAAVRRDLGGAVRPAVRVLRASPIPCVPPQTPGTRAVRPCCRGRSHSRGTYRGAGGKARLHHSLALCKTGGIRRRRARMRIMAGRAFRPGRVRVTRRAPSPRRRPSRAGADPGCRRGGSPAARRPPG